MLLLGSWCAACAPSEHTVQPVAFDAADMHEQLVPLGRAIGNSRIVLLGENGHGVAEFTEAKVRLVEWLHEEHGFDVVAFESGFFECGHVWNRIETLTAREALYQCLSYPFQHAELLPLFEYIRERGSSDRPLVLAGTDIQEQGFDSEMRPVVLHDVLDPVDAGLADRIATLDTALFLLERFGGLDDAAYAWAAEHGVAAMALYDSAAARTGGWARWVFRLATGWIDRLAVRGTAEAAGASGRPARYYELRDEWMARAVAALADSIDGRRKVVVWLHNDHARYGDFSMSSEAHRSAGGYLRDWYGDDVFAIGLFMGRGVITDNGRNRRPVAEPDTNGIERMLQNPTAPASYLVLRDRAPEWTRTPRPYLRMGLDAMTLVPAEVFDALLYVDSVRPPNYDVPSRHE